MWRWSDAEPGWTGDPEARFSLASGNTEYLEFAGGASAMYEGEEFTDDPADDVEHEFRGSFFVSAIGDVTETLRIDLSAFYQPLFSDWGDDRVFLASSLRTDVVGELDLVVRFDLTYESRPPAGVEPTDVRLGTGIVLDF